MDDELAIDGDARFQTFVGGGFGTVQVEQAVGTDPTPRSVSGPGYLRGGLPGLYTESDLAVRFVGAFEEVLDALVAAIDNLPEHFDVTYAPRDVLDMLTRWLGLEHDEARSGEERRRLLEHAPELMRRRGTKAGLELALELAFPDVPLRVEDAGGVSWSLEQPTAGKETSPSFVVYCDMPLAQDRLAAVARLIDRTKPAHARYRLRVRAPKQQPEDEA